MTREEEKLGEDGGEGKLERVSPHLYQLVCWVESLNPDGPRGLKSSLLQLSFVVADMKCCVTVFFGSSCLLPLAKRTDKRRRA